MTTTPDAPNKPLPPVKAGLWRFGRWPVIVLVVLLLSGAGYYAWRTWLAGDSSADKLITAVVQSGDLEDTITATGTLQPIDYVDVGTQVSGQLKKLRVALGDKVTQGELLAEIDPTVYLSKVDADEAQLLNQQAQLADKAAQLHLAEQQLARQQRLTQENATTTELLQSAQAAQLSAKAQVDALHAQIKQTNSTLRGDKANLGYTKIYAPMAGTVVSVAAKQGQTLNANQQAPIVLRIADLSSMTVEAQVSEADITKLRLEMPVYFTTLGDTRRYHSKLRQIPPTPNVVNNVVLYDALFDVANPQQALMSQMTAQVFFVTASARKTLLVPIAALRPAAVKAKPASGHKGRSGDGPLPGSVDPRSQFSNAPALVSVVGSDGKVVDRNVQVGVTNRVSAQILAGLVLGERVLIGTRPANGTAHPANTAPALAARTTGGRP